MFLKVLKMVRDISDIPQKAQKKGLGNIIRVVANGHARIGLLSCYITRSSKIKQRLLSERDI